MKQAKNKVFVKMRKIPVLTEEEIKFWSFEGLKNRTIEERMKSLQLDIDFLEKYGMLYSEFIDSITCISSEMSKEERLEVRIQARERARLFHMLNEDLNKIRESGVLEQEWIQAPSGMSREEMRKFITSNAKKFLTMFNS